MLEKQFLITQLEQHQTAHSEEALFRQQVTDFLLRNDEFWQRSTLEGHVTGSAWVLSPDGSHALLIHHKKLDRWLQPGGHVDETDATVADTAWREAVEECGLADLTLLQPAFFDVDVHEIPERAQVPAHFHYDLRYLFRAGNMELAADFAEVKNIRWVSLLDLIGEETAPSIRRMALKSIEGNF